MGTTRRARSARASARWVPTSAEPSSANAALALRTRRSPSRMAVAAGELARTVSSSSTELDALLGGQLLLADEPRVLDEQRALERQPLDHAQAFPVEAPVVRDDEHDRAQRGPAGQERHDRERLEAEPFPDRARLLGRGDEVDQILPQTLVDLRATAREQLGHLGALRRGERLGLPELLHQVGAGVRCVAATRRMRPSGSRSRTVPQSATAGTIRSSTRASARSGPRSVASIRDTSAKRSANSESNASAAPSGVPDGPVIHGLNLLANTVGESSGGGHGPERGALHGRRTRPRSSRSTGRTASTRGPAACTPSTAGASPVRRPIRPCARHRRHRSRPRVLRRRRHRGPRRPRAGRSLRPGHPGRAGPAWLRGPHRVRRRLRVPLRHAPAGDRRGHGLAAGVGLGARLLLRDVRFAAEGASSRPRPVDSASRPSTGLSRVLPRLVGVGHAVDLLISSRVVEADEAARMGLVNRARPRPSSSRPLLSLRGGHRHVDLTGVGPSRQGAAVRRPPRRRGASRWRARRRCSTDGAGPDFAEGVAVWRDPRVPEWPCDEVR